MATDIKISELNEIATNNNLNHIIVNDRENAGDEGITKKIKLENFLTPNIVKSTNIENGSIISSKIAGLAVDCSKIANNTITCNQIAQCTVNNFVLDSNAVDSRVLNNNCGYTVKCLTVAEGAVNIASGTSGCLDVKSGVTSLNFIKYYWPSTQTAGQFLKTDGSGNLSWAEAVPGEATSLVFSEIMPVGTIVPWAGSGNVPDDKWLECNGQTFIGENYPQLRDALGEIWGPSSGDNYRLPDLRGRVVVGAGTSSSDDNGENRTFTVTDKGGEYNHTLTDAESPSHQHFTATTGSASTAELQSNAGNTNLAIEATMSYRETGTTGSLYNQPNFEYILYGATDTANTGVTNSFGNDEAHTNVQPYTTTRYIIKAKPDDVEQFNPILGPGLSASDAGGSTSNITLTSTEIGVKINNDNLTYDGSNAITLKDDISVTNLSASSIKFDDGTLQSTYEKAAFYTVEVAAANNYTDPSQFVGNVISTHDQYSKGFISTGTNNKFYTAYNSMLYTMNVKVLTDTTVTLYNYVNDDYFYIYVDGTLEYTGSNYDNTNSPRVVEFALTTGNRKVEIVKNDSGSGSNSFDLLGNIISSNVLFLSGK